MPLQFFIFYFAILQLKLFSLRCLSFIKLLGIKFSYEVHDEGYQKCFEQVLTSVSVLLSYCFCN